MAHRSTPLSVFADDLSGAAEVAGMFGPGTQVSLGVAPDQGASTLIVDLDTRSGSAEEARAAQARALASVPPGGRVIKKVDSLLRGHVAAEVRALLEAGRRVVVCPALPAQGRTVVRGVVHLHGTPLHATDAWRVEPAAPPQSIADVLPAGVPVAHAALAELRSGRLGEVVACSGTPIVVCDAETAADVDAVAACVEGDPRVVLVGSAELCRRAARGQGSAPDAPRPASTRHCLTVVGTASPVARAQAEALVAASGARAITLPVGALLAADEQRVRGWATAVADALAVGDVVVTLAAGGGDVGVGRGRELTRQLAALARRALASAAPTDLILTGGETARAVLDALGHASLTVVAVPEHGVILSQLPDGSLLGTKPGSFGDPAALVRLHTARLEN